MRLISNRVRLHDTVCTHILGTHLFVYCFLRLLCTKEQKQQISPLMKNLTPIFYNTVLTLCPQLNTALHLLSRMLSRTLISKHKFLRRQNRIQPMPSAMLSDNGHGDDDDNSSKYVGNTYCISHCSCRRSNRCTLKQVQRTSTTRTGHYNQR